MCTHSVTPFCKTSNREFVTNIHIFTVGVHSFISSIAKERKKEERKRLLRKWKTYFGETTTRTLTTIEYNGALCIASLPYTKDIFTRADRATDGHRRKCFLSFYLYLRVVRAFMHACSYSDWNNICRQGFRVPLFSAILSSSNARSASFNSLFGWLGNNGI